MSLIQKTSSSETSSSETKSLADLGLLAQRGWQQANAYHFDIVKYRQFGRILVVQIIYPDCTNYEGNKILIFNDCHINIIQCRKGIDPHFVENSNYELLARFQPTEKGWRMAVDFARIETARKYANIPDLINLTEDQFYLLGTTENINEFMFLKNKYSVVDENSPID